MSQIHSSTEASPLLPLVDGHPSGEATSTNALSSNKKTSTKEQGSLALSIRELSTQLSSFISYHTGSIGTVGSVSIAVNSITGPAMLGLPALFARCGVIPTCLTVLFVACLCSFCSLHLANTISKVEGNGNFRKEIEYSEAFRRFWGDVWFSATQVLFFFCITCLNISSIVDTAQVVDTIFGNWWPWGGTVAIHIDTTDFQWSMERWDDNACTEMQRKDGSCTPFSGSDGLLFTLGNLMTTLAFFPVALLDLKENAWFQVIAFLVLLLTSIQFVVTFAASDLDLSGTSFWGEDWDDLLGVVLFNFPLVFAIPAWLYEREPDVDVPSVVHGSCAFSAILYILIGMLGQMAMPHVSDNMLQSMMSGAFGLPLQLGASIFAFFIVGFGIPLFSVLTRLNLVGSGLCSKGLANILSVYLPFGLSWFLYDSTVITKILSWGGMIFTSLIAFIFPILLTMHAITKGPSRTGSVQVYFGFWTDPAAELFSLRILLVCAVVTVVWPWSVTYFRMQ